MTKLEPLLSISDDSYFLETNLRFGHKTYHPTLTAFELSRTLLDTRSRDNNHISAYVCVLECEAIDRY